MESRSWTENKKKQRSSVSSKEKKHDAAKKLENILSNLALSNKLNMNKLVSSTIPDNYEKAKLKYCLELADIVITPEQKLNLSCSEKS